MISWVFFVSVVNVRILPVTSCRSPKQEAVDHNSSLCSHLLRHLAESLCQAAGSDTSTHTLISFSHCRMLSHAKSKKTPFASICSQGKGQSVTTSQPLLFVKQLVRKSKSQKYYLKFKCIDFKGNA